MLRTISRPNTRLVSKWTRSASTRPSPRTHDHPRTATPPPRLVLLLLGAGASLTAVGLVASFLVDPPAGSTIHADSEPRAKFTPPTDDRHNFELIVEADGNSHIECQPAPGLWRRDSFQLASNFPIEDVITNTNYEFSPTLTLSCTTILDGHNGSRLADFLGQVLPVAVMGEVGDVYSKYANADSEEALDRSGWDVSGGGVEVAFELEGAGEEQQQPTKADPGRAPGEPPDPRPPADELDEAIKRAFIGVDDFVVHDSVRGVLGLTKDEYAALCAGNNEKEGEGADSNPRKETSRAKAAQALSYPYSGSCAIMGLFDPQERALRVALTGDLRAVYGRRVLDPSSPSSSSTSTTPKYTYKPDELTADQNALNPSEITRLTALHPDEPALFKDKRVLGWGPSRAFGDGSMKWARSIQERLRAGFLGDRVREICKTPPYFTAEPVVTTKTQVRRGDFVVFASDGLWDCLGSEEVVGLVGVWLEERGVRDREKKGEAEVLLPSLKLPTTRNGKKTQQRTYAPSDLPVVYPADHQDRTSMYKYWRAEKHFVCEDENVAAHLTRNAIGGADGDLRDALSMMDVPRSRRFRDDISVVVVFFD